MTSLGGSFCGFGATQVPQDFALWERVLNDAEGLVGIVELGTAYGGFSVFLETQARYRGLEFATFDSIDPRSDPVDQLFGRPASRPPVPPLPYFQRVELVRGGPAREVLACLDHGPVVLFCDDGDKAAEVATYGPFLAPGSLCLVHDWGREIGPDAIPSFMAERYGEVCDEIESWTRVFEVAG